MEVKPMVAPAVDPESKVKELPALVTAPTLSTLAALLPVSNVVAAVRVTLPISIRVLVVLIVPAAEVELGLETLPVVARPPAKVIVSAAPSPKVTVPVFKKLVSPATELVVPVSETLYAPVPAAADMPVVTVVLPWKATVEAAAESLIVIVLAVTELLNVAPLLLVTVNTFIGETPPPAPTAPAKLITPVLPAVKFRLRFAPELSVVPVIPIAAPVPTPPPLVVSSNIFVPSNTLSLIFIALPAVIILALSVVVAPPPLIVTEELSEPVICPSTVIEPLGD
jgi:hypothetical protein